MKLTLMAVSAAALIASAPAVFAKGVSSRAAGHELQQHGTKHSTQRYRGASRYAPGHEMQQRSTQGYRGYAPGQTMGIAGGSGTSGGSGVGTSTFGY
jgi:hypothetical protein